MILTPLVIAQLFSIGTGLGSQVMKMTGNDEVAQKLAIPNPVSGAVNASFKAPPADDTAPETILAIPNFCATSLLPVIFAICDPTPVPIENSCAITSGVRNISFSS